MNTLGWILIIIATFVLSSVLTFFIAKKYMIKYIENQMNFSDDMIEMAMNQMGAGSLNKKQKEKIKKQLQGMSSGGKQNVATGKPVNGKNKKVK